QSLGYVFTPALRPLITQLIAKRRCEWVDTNLRWNTSDYGGIQDLRITPEKIWKPDILMYNSYDGFALDLRLSSEDGGDISTYIANGEWVLMGQYTVYRQYEPCYTMPVVQSLMSTLHLP
ncbi:unnamed protein product, partial [Medioppia subpectinata]